VSVPEGATILEATRKLVHRYADALLSRDTRSSERMPRLCSGTGRGAHSCPGLLAKAEAGMVIHTESERVRLSRRLVLEFLASSVDVSTAPALQQYLKRYGAKPERFGTRASTVGQEAKIDNDLYMRDYSKCILCYKCVEACGVDAQNTFAIGVAGRGFSAHISTEFDIPAAGIRVRLLRELHRRCPNRRAYV